MKRRVRRLIEQTKAEMALASANYAALEHVQTRVLEVGECSIVLQHNPARIVSTTAKVDAETLRNRKCFLCEENLPQGQPQEPWLEGKYQIRVNPYPIFKEHLVVSLSEHLPQELGERFGDMLKLSAELDDFVVFYNGAHCGASAPDHMHFQAAAKGSLPVVRESKTQEQGVLAVSDVSMLSFVSDPAGRFYYSLSGRDASTLKIYFSVLMQNMPSVDGNEPWVNVICDYEEGIWTVLVFPRYCTRPHCYYGESIETVMVSPASVEMGGVMILPKSDDFEKMSIPTVKRVYREVSMSLEESEEILEKIRKQIETTI